METYRAAVIGCSHMGGFIDNERPDSPAWPRSRSHGASFYACERTEGSSGTADRVSPSLTSSLPGRWVSFSWGYGDLALVGPSR